MRYSSIATAGLTLLLLGCDFGSDEPLVARAGDYELTRNEAVQLLAPASQVPNEPEILEAMAELWIDYTLLADVASRDSTLESVDVSPLVDQEIERQLIMELRSSVIDADTTVSDDELEEIFRREAQGIEVRARHILLGYPEQSTREERDSVRSLLTSIRDRIESGEDFGELARRYSQDQGTAVEGGDLGFFGAGEMVRPFEEAAFALEPGELSDIVETPYGLHLIRVEEKQVPTFEERKNAFRRQVTQRRVFQAESTYVAGLVDASTLELRDDAVELTRQVAREPGTRLSGRAARRTLVSFEGGALTVEEVRDFMRTQSPQVRSRIADATDEVIETNVLQSLARQELLVSEAREEGMEVSEAERDSLTRRARRQFVQAARSLGFLSIEPEEGQDRREAVQEAVLSRLERILAGQQLLPLGPIAFTLRKQESTEIFENSFGPTLEQVARIRGPEQPGTAQGAQQRTPTPPPATPDTTSPDSVGGG